MTSKGQYARHTVVSAGKWRLKIDLKELRVLLPDLADFSKAIKSRDHDDDSSALQDATDFLQYLDQKSASEQGLTTVVQSFEREFLQDRNIHSVAHDLGNGRGKILLRLLSKYGGIFEGGSKARTSSGLLEAAHEGTASILAIFGGQGLTNSSCLSEIRTIVETYGPIVADLVDAASQCLMTLSAKPRAQKFFTFGEFDLKTWLTDPLTAPDQSRIAQAPISFPLIGVLSLLQYWVSMKTTHSTPYTFRTAFEAVTGHSQGILAAAVASVSDGWSDFLINAILALKILFWIGLESHLAAPPTSLFSQSLLEFQQGNEGRPSHMLSVRGLSSLLVEEHVQEANHYLPPEQRIYIALRNNPSSFVVAGPPQSLLGLRESLRLVGVAEDVDQSRIPHPARKKVIHCSFLPISAPFHSAYLVKAFTKVMDHLRDEAWECPPSPTPLIHTSTGKKLYVSQANGSVAELVRMVMVEPVDWLQTCLTTPVSHIIDFGPAKCSILLRSSVEGSQTRVVLLSDTQVDILNYGPNIDFYTSIPPSVCSSWRTEYRPRLKTGQKKGRIETRMSTILGVPPIMVAGMTPTTVSPSLVSAILNAGYHAELAGGGYTDSKQFEEAIRVITANMRLNRGLTCNIIYVNPRAVAWQIPLIKSMIAKGVRIYGLTVGGGVPSIDIATEWIRTLGLRHISFKPGSIASIEQVLEIADQNPTFPIGLQWTGGRAGGHHSYEDFHEPMVKMYGAIRHRKNIVLIAGGGFGDAESIAPYLTGEWSAVYRRPWMPFDGALLGSRIMAAKEAMTSDSVKRLMAQASGCSDAEWHHSYVQPTGGVLTVLSEMGQPIHVLSNRAMLLWKDMDDRVFSVRDPTARLKVLSGMKQSIIDRLNSDFAKPWFATLGKQATEIEDMTYQQSLERLVELMYIRNAKRWIHHSYKTLVCDWMQRVSQRLTEDGAVSIPSMANAQEDLNDFLKRVAAAGTTLIYPDDVSFFMNLCRRRGQKPVNFVPRIDSDFETWFKKDSLWQSEDIQAVPEQDPQRVCIIYGPVAARYTLTANEPVSSILDEIHADLARRIASEPGTDVQLPTPTHVKEISEPIVTNFTHQVTKEDLQGSLDVLLDRLIPGHMQWARTCLLEKYILRDGEAVENPIRGAFKPQLLDDIVVTSPVLGVQSIVLKPDSSREHQYRRPLRLEYDEAQRIRMILMSPAGKSSNATLTLHFELAELDDAVELHETTTDRDECIRKFYAEIWNCELWDAVGTNPRMDTQQDMTITRDLVEDYLTIIGTSDKLVQTSGLLNKDAPIDICIVVAWQTLMQGLLDSQSHGNLFRLLHRSAEFNYVSGCPKLAVGDRVRTSSQVKALSTTASGRSVVVKANISRDDQLAVQVTSEFFIQGKFEANDVDFSVVEERSMLIKVDSRKLSALLRSRTWLKLNEPSIELLGTNIVFQLESSVKKSRIVVTGPISTLSRDGRLQKIGLVHFDREAAPRNPVMDFLERHGTSQKQVVPLQQPGWHQGETLTLQIPKAGHPYSNISSDRNPIHTCPYFAGFAGLEQPITHGMFTSAAVRRVVEQASADADCSRFRRWSCFFDAPVTHGQTLQVKIEHIAMVEGRMLLQVTGFEAESKEQVLHAEAEVEQAPTAYVFCGQGAQERAMGMSLYDSDPEAKDIWDRGDKHLRRLYGFSLIDIVRDDPKKLTIHFGGKRGRSIRQNYLNISRNICHDGKHVSESVLVGLNPQSTSYTFSDSRGLLFSTQFAQPALTLMEIAEKKALEARGGVQQNAIFAGHSLGEYSALAACTSFMSLEELLDLVFYRGLIMQRAIERDEHGQTEFCMVAVNPSRVGTWFNEDSFKELVRLISMESDLLLEIVNWNIEGQQYVCAGNLRALLLLTKACDELSRMTGAGSDILHLVVQRLLPSCLPRTERISLPKGVATTPLNGIDVPFHSTVLRSGIDGYRAYLKDKIVIDDIKPAQFVDKWIPNVVGKPFSLDREYVEEVQRITNSEPLRVLLETCA